MVHEIRWKIRLGRISYSRIRDEGVDEDAEMNQWERGTWIRPSVLDTLAVYVVIRNPARFRTTRVSKHGKRACKRNFNEVATLHHHTDQRINEPSQEASFFHWLSLLLVSLASSLCVDEFPLAAFHSMSDETEESSHRCRYPIWLVLLFTATLFFYEWHELGSLCFALFADQVSCEDLRQCVA